MSRNRFARTIVIALALLGGARLCSAEFGEILDVPFYGTNYSAQDPRAGMEIMGGWDRWGYSNLVSGSSVWWLNQSTISNAIVSPEHMTDYAEYGGSQDDPGNITPDLSSINPGGAHASNSMADFMRSSQSAFNLSYGFTDPTKIAGGITDYAASRGYSFTATRQAADWATLKHEIDFGRPVLLDGGATVVGYSTEDGIQQIEYYFADYSTHQPRVLWSQFQPSQYQMVLARPAGTPVETAYAAAGGLWSASGSWSNGLPTAGAYVHIPLGKTVNLNSPAQSGMTIVRGGLNISDSLDTTSLRIFGLAEQTAGQVDVASSLTVADNFAVWIDGQSVYKGRYRLSGGQLNVDDRILTRAGGRFEWYGGTLNVPLVEVDGGVFSLGLDGQIGGAGGLNITAVKNGIVEIARGADISQAVESRTLDILRVGVDSLGGTYEFPDGATLQTTGIDVGVNGFGSFHQQGGSVVASGVPGYDLGGLMLGVNLGAEGTYQIDDGTLTVYKIEMGYRSAGTFVQNGGTVDSGFKLNVGSALGGTGTYELHDGVLLGKHVKITDSFIQTGGSFTISGSGGSSLSVTGQYELEDGELHVRNQSFSIGSVGRFRQTAGLVDADAIEVYGGDGSTYHGYELIDGDLQIVHGLSIGGSSTQDGEFYQEAGAITADKYMIYHGNSFQSGGSVVANELHVGRNGTGPVANMEISGGTLTLGKLFVGQDGYTTRTRELNISGPATIQTGTLLIADNSEEGNGSFVVEDASADITLSTELVLGRRAAIDVTPGTVLKMHGAHYKNGSTHPELLGGLQGLTLEFSAGPSVTHTIEVASPVPVDPLAVPTTFGIGTIVLGGGNGIGRASLVNNLDNHIDNNVAESLLVDHLVINDGSSLELNGYRLYYNSLTLGSGAVLNTGGGPLNVAAGQELSGKGTIGANVIVGAGGSVAPGASPGILTVNGTYTQQQTASATLFIEIGGLIAGQQHDRLLVTGAATLGGVLNVQLIDGFFPNAGDEFDILLAISRSGVFADVVGEYLGQGRFFDVAYDPTIVTLIAEQADLGDADLDGDVDLSDLALLAASYGLNNGGIDWMNGDFDHDNDVDLNDLSTLAASYGSGEAQAFADFQELITTGVPEPAGLVAVALLGLTLQRRRATL